MVKEYPNKKECFETIRECIKGKMPLKAIIDLCLETYPEVHEKTLYKWHLKVKEEEEIEAWENNSFMEIQNERQLKVDFKKRLYLDAKKDYEDAYEIKEDIKLIQSLRQECLSHLKNVT